MVLQAGSSEGEKVPETHEATILQSTSILEKTKVTPPEVSLTKSFIAEVQTSDINSHVYDTDVNVIMGEGNSNKEIVVSTQGIPVSSDTFVSLPPFIVPITNTTNSPTFETILTQPITTLFSSQTIEPLPSSEDTDIEDGEFWRNI